MATPKTELQKFLDTKKADTRLIGEIERHLMRQPESDRRTDVLHPSEIIKADWCHKYAYYLLNGGKAKKENLILDFKTYLMKVTLSMLNGRID